MDFTIDSEHEWVQQAVEQDNTEQEEELAAWETTNRANNEYSLEEVKESANNPSNKDYWQDIAEQVYQDAKAESEVPDTKVESLSDSRKQITTKFDDLKLEIEELHQDPSKQSQITERNGEVITAVVHEGEQ
jgi:dsDNA-binding SOS-regulon protein